MRDSSWVYEGGSRGETLSSPSRIDTWTGSTGDKATTAVNSPIQTEVGASAYEEILNSIISFVQPFARSCSKVEVILQTISSSCDSGSLRRDKANSVSAPSSNMLPLYITE